MQTLNNPFEPCNKLRGKNVVKEVFMRPLLLRLLSLRRYVSSIYMYATVTYESQHSFLTDKLAIQISNISFL